MLTSARWCSGWSGCFSAAVNWVSLVLLSFLFLQDKTVDRQTIRFFSGTFHQVAFSNTLTRSTFSVSFQTNHFKLYWLGPIICVYYKSLVLLVLKPNGATGLSPWRWKLTSPLLHWWATHDVSRVFPDPAGPHRTVTFPAQSCRKVSKVILDSRLP